MGLTKTTLFTPEQNRIADLAKAFAHPARVAIIMHLLQRKSCVCGDLVNVLPLSQSTVSQHLKELKRIGIIHGNIEGASICYCINSEIWEEVNHTFSTIFKTYENCC